MDGKYPKEISEGFPGIPNDIEAVIFWKKAFYFFKGSNVYAHFWGQPFRPLCNADTFNENCIFADWNIDANHIDGALAYSDDLILIFEGNTIKYHRFNRKSLTFYVSLLNSFCLFLQI